MAEPAFDRAAFAARLGTRRVARELIVRAETPSTNDEAWEALAAGGPDGLAVVADAQTAGRGRAGRSWTHVPGRSLALSVALHTDVDPRYAGVIALAAGLAVAEGLESLGAAARLKWPNDVLLGGRKVSGVLCELRRLPGGAPAVVVGIGVNVRQRPEDFPAGLTGVATSLAIAGVDAALETVAAAVLDALEARWDQCRDGGRPAVLAAWRARAAFWGEAVTVRIPGGVVTGIARSLAEDGALVLEREGGELLAVRAGDLEAGAAAGSGR